VDGLPVEALVEKGEALPPRLDAPDIPVERAEVPGNPLIAPETPVETAEMPPRLDPPTERKEVPDMAEVLLAP